MGFMPKRTALASWESRSEGGGGKGGSRGSDTTMQPAAPCHPAWDGVCGTRQPSARAS